MRPRRALLHTAALLACLAWSPGTHARALFGDATGLWLIPNAKPGQLYGASSADANWSVGQWNIPQELPAFRGNVAQNAHAKVQMLGAGRFDLSQNGGGLTCSKQYRSGVSDVHEFDLLLHPNNGNTPRFPRADIAPAAVLGSLTHLIDRFAVEPVSVAFDDADCSVTRALFMSGIVLSNPARHQTIFYQLRLAVVDRNGWSLGKPFWFMTGQDARGGLSGQFGYDDSITAYGQPTLAPRGLQRYEVDLLPHLKAMLTEGKQYGFDQDPDHWTVRGAYFGDVVWGHTKSSSRWSALSVSAE